MSSTVIAGFARTPFAFARKGVLAQTRPDDLAPWCCGPWRRAWIRR